MYQASSIVNLDSLTEDFSKAYLWLKAKRKNYPPDSDIWDFRREWNKQLEAIIKSFSDGSYRFSVQKRVQLSNGETVFLWSSRDALVLKVLTGILKEVLKSLLYRTCYHLKGHGGLKGAVKEVMERYLDYRFFFKTDVRGYYESIDHHVLLMNLSDCIKDNKIIRYVWQFLNRSVEWGGLYWDIKRGISRGSPLSPLLGAFYLRDLDSRIDRLKVRYFRYMDDILILAPTRWKLKEAIRALNGTFQELKLEKHPEKTTMGRIEKGFDFLGYHFGSEGISLARKTIQNFIEKALRLYEQEPPHRKMRRLGEYVNRWGGWVRGTCEFTERPDTIMSLFNNEMNGAPMLST